MSTSPRDAQDEGADKQSLDELEEPQPTADAEAGTSTATPVKRGRGRPKGSRNKKSLTGASAAADASMPATPRKRGRPPKVRSIALFQDFLSLSLQEKKEEDGEERAPKRPRGRPPKNPRPQTKEGETSGAGGSGDPESSTKKKRGRPSKNAAAT
ncbi:hypothetical protein K443DRAFT_531328 [Laccaria amethystina LaAM-08-1]|uniref:Uncharacterized protein n=1 Tax=Laccaria amethystina LaAM-08-1 TaxID=1095629 RepID=A0A0C9X910_9AGAR|nr:hypothetical protein K443DRAFT_531328 [Laccaria amethystina LaAM-08-1]